MESQLSPVIKATKSTAKTNYETKDACLQQNSSLKQCKYYHLALHKHLERNYLLKSYISIYLLCKEFLRSPLNNISAIASVTKEVLGTLQITYQGQEIDFSLPWRRVTMHQAVQDATGLDFNTFSTFAEAKAATEKAGIAVSPEVNSIGRLLNEVFEEKVETTLIQPTFIMDYPVEISPLAKPHRSQPGLVERFELFIVGRETANSFSELTDPIDQRQRLEAQAERKAEGDLEAHGVDEDFLTALEYGMPPTGGLGIGIDRLVMVLTDCASIRDAIAFPLLKSSSSFVKEHNYDAATQILTIKFNNGSIYKYQDVPSDVAQGLETATSTGQYFNESIKDKYAFDQVRLSGG